LNKKIEQLYEYRISKAEFEQLEELDKVLVSVICFAASEINMFSKLYLCSSPDFCDETLLDSLIASQKMTVLRSWSAKLFELHEFAKQFQSQKGGSADARSAVRLFLSKFDGQDDRIGFNVARALRNEVTNHYSLPAAKKNLKHVSDRANLVLLLHCKDGNSSYPMGEEVLFAGRVNRFASGKNDGQNGHKLLEKWYQFNLDATKLARELLNDVIASLIFAKYPEKFARQKTFFVDDEFSQEHGAVCVPLFLRST